MQPASLIKAAELAKLQEDKQLEFRVLMRPRPNMNPGSSSGNFQDRAAKPPLLNTPTVPKLPFKHLSAAETQARRDKGLCFNCDEKWGPNHRCKARFLFLLGDDIDGEQTDMVPGATVEAEFAAHIGETEEAASQLSLNAFVGHYNPKTFRVTAQVSRDPIQILIDSGSSHNFLQAQVAMHLGLITESTKPLSVLVGNGETLTCSQLARQVSLNIQGHIFKLDFHLINLNGSDEVLGIQWLKLLGLILTDYDQVITKFMWAGRMVQLTGNPDPQPLGTSVHQFRWLFSSGQIMGLFSLSISSPRLQHSDTSIDHQLLADLQQLLTTYIKLFTSPTTLPPPRPTDHYIHLLPNTAPVKVKPYRYPHFQKQEIENQVAKMLQTGEIQLSTSAFSFPVLLVKKKDGSWRFCVDYRALNAITVKDSYPIPTVEELLDELGGAVWFSKLDLRSGYHQIRMQPEDSHKIAFRTHDGHHDLGYATLLPHSKPQ